MQRIFRPHNLLLMIALVLILISFFVTSTTVDIHVHDTYYVVVYQQIFWLITLLLLFYALLYKVASRRLFSTTLTGLHLIITIATLPVFLFFPLLTYRTPGRFIDLSHWSSFNRDDYSNGLIRGLLVLFVLAQLIFIINLLGGSSRKTRSH